MDTTMAKEKEAAWRRQASQTQLKVNAAWWLQSFAPWLAGIGLGGFAIIFYLRTQWMPLHPWLVAGSLGAAILVAVLGAWYWARRRFYSLDECLVRLEGHLRLDNALSAAVQGVAPWPAAPRQPVDDGFRWRWQWVAAPVLVAATSLILAFLIPVKSQDTAAYVPPLPSSLQQAEKLLSDLSQQEVTRKEDVQNFQDAVEKLRQQPVEEWYSHNNLEAADHLKESVQNAAAELARNSGEAARRLESLENLSAEDSEAARKLAAKGLEQAIQGLRSGAMQPNKDLMKQLQGLDPENLLKQLSPEQLQQLKEGLKKCQGACKNCGGNGMGSEEQSLRDQLNGEASKQSENSGQAEGKLGAGTPERGPGVAPLGLSQKESEAKSDKVHQPESHDSSRLTPGDLLQTTDGQHQVDQSPASSGSGGGIQGVGQGGDAVWKESLLPAEKKVLQKYFK